MSIDVVSGLVMGERHDQLSRSDPHWRDDQIPWIRVRHREPHLTMAIS